jgi:large conductance mechanosensitive channel
MVEREHRHPVVSPLQAHQGCISRLRVACRLGSRHGAHDTGTADGPAGWSSPPVPTCRQSDPALRVPNPEEQRSVKNILSEFKEFIMRGNVVDLAVAVVVGTAFAALIKSFSADILMQIVGIFAKNPNFDSLHITINHSEIRYGSFLTNLVNFLIVALAMFLVIKGINSLQNLRRRDEVAEEHELTEIELLTQIRDSLRAAQD